MELAEFVGRNLSNEFVEAIGKPSKVGEQILRGVEVMEHAWDWIAHQKTHEA